MSRKRGHGEGSIYQLPDGRWRGAVSIGWKTNEAGQPVWTRKVVTVSEVTGMEGDVVVMQDIFVFEKRGVDRDGKVLGEYRATGVRPKFLDAVHAAGIHLGANVFAYRKK